MEAWMLAGLPVVGATIGYSTNWLAVRMLFRPRRPRRVLGLSIHGVIPRRQKELAANIADTVERELLNVDEIQHIIDRLVRGDSVRALLRKRLETLLNEQIDMLGGMAKMVATNLGLVQKLEKKLEDELIHFVESMAGQLQSEVASSLNIREKVKEKIEGFDLNTLEKIILRIASRELRTIELLGGVLGFAIGLGQVAFVLATGAA